MPKKELTISEVARRGAIARNAQLTEDERKEASAHANRSRWGRLSPEQRRAQTAKARAERKKKAKKRRAKSRKRKS